MTPARLGSNLPQPPPLLATPKAAPLLIRLIKVIRFDEVLALQGAPIMGALLAVPELSAAKAPSLFVALLVMMIGNGLLVGHIFMINDWAGIDGDKKDPNRSGRTFLTQGISSKQIGVLSIILLILSLICFAGLNLTSLSFTAAITGLSLLYSAPRLHLKGRPGFSTALHMIGGSLHFMLGYSVFAPISLSALTISGVFGLVFSAGHFTHEARDHDADASNGIRTNAVALGLKSGLIAGYIGFSLAYAILFGLAIIKILPDTLLVAGPLFVLHTAAFLNLMRHQPTYRRIKDLQRFYRLLFCVIGMAILVGTIRNWSF